nr:MAG TPA: hypothetical protein [Caudoviricetes sp.]
MSENECYKYLNQFVGVATKAILSVRLAEVRRLIIL